MRKTAIIRRRSLALVVALIAAAAVFLVPANPAAAVTRPLAMPDEGGSKKLRDALEAAAKGHIEAKAKLNSSKKRQAALTKQMKGLQARHGVLLVEVGAVANESYRVGRLSAVSVLLNSASPEAFLDRAAGLDLIAQHDDRKLRALIEARQQLARGKAAIDREVAEQRKQVAVLAKKKRDAERALAAVGGLGAGGFISANSPLARPAPRDSDGSWPRESCSVNDPTTSGCITPRTLHAYNQARSAGFKRHTSCYRGGGGGEHPKGRACDFASAEDGFRNSDAYGDDRRYGNNLAAFFVKNASRLGVMYVIWYRQIWMPNTGWRSYSGGGSPSGDHTNHVHLSMY